MSVTITFSSRTLRSTYSTAYSADAHSHAPVPLCSRLCVRRPHSALCTRKSVPASRLLSPAPRTPHAPVVPHTHSCTPPPQLCIAPFHLPPHFALRTRIAAHPHTSLARPHTSSARPHTSPRPHPCPCSRTRPLKRTYQWSCSSPPPLPSAWPRTVVWPLPAQNP